MNYRYIPDTYKKSEIVKNGMDNDTFVKYQIKYKESFEKYLLKYINIQNIESFLNSQDFEIPTVNDKEYNFYHQSSFGSKYIYLRNNIHIEYLNKDELNALNDACTNNNMLNTKFLLKTYQKVLFENTDNTFFGSIIPENLVKGKSIIFEFAYDQKRCKSMEQIQHIKNISTKIFEALKRELPSRLNMPISTITYAAIPDIYKN